MELRRLVHRSRAAGAIPQRASSPRAPARPDSGSRRGGGCEPRRVLALVVRAELARPDRLPPAAVLPVPVDRAAQALLERHARRPAERAQPARVEGVAAVVAGTVGHMLQKRRVDAELLDDRVSHVDVEALVAAAHVVRLARLALAEHELDSRAMVLDVEPVAHLAA